ncbi:MAG: MurR/RpiR family transcriptional regulator [Paracoccaceae bacterium]|uniref:MurR/RpiR family transcriptional regulator n=1 Tax=Yoonia sp. TaxID=2212373 RepID=UPI0032770AAF
MDPTLKSKTISMLKGELPDLSPRLQTVAKYIVDHPADFGLDPIRETARKSGVSTYTLVRMAKHLNFDSFEDLREPFRHALVASTQVTDLPEWLNNLYSSGAKGAAQAEAAANSIGVVHRSLELQTTGQLERVVEMLLGARNTYLTAVRASYGLAYYFHYVGRMALPSLQLIPRHMNSAIDELNDAGPEDVLIAITFTPYSKETIEACRFANERGVKLIILSDSEIVSSEFTPHENLIVSVVSTHHFGCYVGAMAVMEGLLAMLVEAGGNDAKHRIKNYEDLRQSHDAYWGPRKKH